MKPKELGPELRSAVADRFKVLAEPARLTILNELRKGCREGLFVHYELADESVFALSDIICGQLQRHATSRAAALG